MATREVILIAGPTASGKSALALHLARQRDGMIVNADSMQVYSVLDRLTARPAEKELSLAPHRLYGHVSPCLSYSTGDWLKDVATLLSPEAERHAGPVIFVGGTGLYFRALTAGLSEMPDIPTTVRRHWRERLAAEGANALHADLAKRDPLAAGRIRPGDGQRIVRALEVLEASGRSIVSWQGVPGAPLVSVDQAEKYVLLPDREQLARRIARRFADMIEEGAVDEVRTLLALDPDPSAPAMKAIGVREISRWLGGEIPIDRAVSEAVTATRQYAKRQSTWFRNQLSSDWKPVRDVTEIVGNANGSGSN